MLEALTEGTRELGLAQAAVAALLAIAIVLSARRVAIHLESEVLVSLVRGIVQVVAIGSVIVLLLEGPAWTTVFVLAGMMLAGAAIARRRIQGLPGSFRTSLAGIAAGSGLVIGLMTGVGVIDPGITSLLPVGSMIIASTMNSVALAVERFRSDVESHTGLIEAGLSLGADPRSTVAPFVSSSVGASVLPHLNALRSLGIVWIPGLMAGMVISGTDPVYAAIYQFVVIAMIFSAGALASLVSILVIRSYAFSEAEQLVIRPGCTTRPFSARIIQTIDGRFRRD